MKKMKSTIRNTDEIKPTYVTFEQAKLLKEKGFDVKVDSNFASLNQFFETTIHKTDWNNRSDKLPNKYSAPEQWQVIEWLRVKHGIWVSVRLNNTKDNWMYFLQDIKTKELTKNIKDGFNSPQEAYSAAFDYILTNLI